jgi:hypothetical protein
LVLDKLTAGDFEPHIGSTFILADGPEVPPLTLAAVERGQVQPGAPRTEPFSLRFTSDRTSRVDQRTHALEHPAMGRLDLFLVPIGPGPDGLLRYEAVFN